MTEDFELEPCDYIDWDEGRDFPAASGKEPVMAVEDRDPKVGDRIEVNGGTRAFTGIVVGVNELLLIVAEAPGRLTYLKRNLASTDPIIWRCAGRPVRVRIITRAITRAQQQTFSKALKDLERKTR